MIALVSSLLVVDPLAPDLPYMLPPLFFFETGVAKLPCLNLLTTSSHVPV
jgi:hypothetical protein